LVEQLPQRVTSDVVFVSQPLVATESQLAKPALQVVYVHKLLAQALPLAFWTWVLQFVAQLPQCVASFVVFVSQPFVALLSQLAYPELHEAYVHALLAQPMPLAFCTCALHIVGHAPQCVASLVVFVSQPFVAFASQLPKPALHAV
jgi:hypothetical protein